jgi:hypothetical protein
LCQFMELDVGFNGLGDQRNEIPSGVHGDVIVMHAVGKALSVQETAYHKLPSAAWR